MLRKETRQHKSWVAVLRVPEWIFNIGSTCSSRRDSPNTMANNAIVSLSIKVDPGTGIVNRQPVFAPGLNHLRSFGHELTWGFPELGIPFWGSP